MMKPHSSASQALSKPRKGLGLMEPYQIILGYKRDLHKAKTLFERFIPNGQSTKDIQELFTLCFMACHDLRQHLRTIDKDYKGPEAIAWLEEHHPKIDILHNALADMFDAIDTYKDVYEFSQMFSAEDCFYQSPNQKIPA